MKNVNLINSEKILEEVLQEERKEEIRKELEQEQVQEVSRDDVYKQSCPACHGADLSGSAAGPSLLKSVANILKKI